MNHDTWLAREPEVYEEPPSVVDPRDEAYAEAMQEIAKLRKTVERLERDAAPINFMYQFNQDFSARTRFDTVLPEDARSELRRPKRPVILAGLFTSRPSVPASSNGSSASRSCAIILVGMLANYSVQRNRQATPAVVPKESTPVVQPTPAPAKPAVQPPIPQIRRSGS